LVGAHDLSILLFNEADAVIGKRKEDAERSVDQKIPYLSDDNHRFDVYMNGLGIS
jgi:hypothetical protein